MDFIEDAKFQTGGKYATEYVKIDRTRTPVNIVFIGHVDAGKSTLCGRILKDTNEVDE